MTGFDEKGGACAIAAKRNHLFPRVLLPFCFAVYLIAVLWYTVGKRSVGYYPAHFSLFWSYRLWFEGKQAYGLQILANIAMFTPFGFLFSAIADSRRPRGFVCVFLGGTAFSLLIETTQYVTMRGCFEFDDVCSNTLGALIGILFFLAIRRFMPERLMRAVLLTAGAGTLLICLGVFAFTMDGAPDESAPLSRGLCFQVEDAACGDDGLRLGGVCFWYEQGLTDYTVVLRSTQTGKRYSLQTERGFPRPDVAAYFNRDSLKAGFQAEGFGIDAGEEYEIILDFGLLRFVPTRVYLTLENSPAHVDIHYVPSGVFSPPEAENTDLEKIVSGGVLRVYDPANHVYVYFYDGSLYWIAEEGFAFQKNRATHLELLLWTTETDKLSEKSRAAGKTWDTIAVYFEKNELDGNFGRYRVCAKELKADYPITSIRTGRYANGWVWKADFWPVFSFSP
ncbi:MAG: VanZ family protein [Clostridia bacterium]|nr:VanZ family protein [Clostridia bacterium]